MDLTQLTLYFLTAILIQALLLIFIKKREIGTGYLIFLGASFIGTNLCLLAMALTDQSNAMAVELLLRFSYVFLFFSAACFLSYALQVCDNIKSSFARQIENGLWVVAFCGAILSVVTDEVVAGYRPIPIGVTAIPGNIHWVALLHGLLALITSAMVLIREWISLEDDNHKRQRLFILTAYISHALISAGVVVMLQYGSEVNLTMTYPISTTLALCLIVYGDYNFGWLTLSKSSTATPRSELSDKHQLNDIFTSYSNGDYSFNEAAEKIELLLITHAYSKHNGNMMKTAEAMGLGRSTLYRKMQKYKLKEG